jgi:O-methyltransferase involved in polyketide biosynthesis
VAARPNFRLHPASIEDAVFEDLVEDGPVFVIAEGLLLYLDAAAQSALWARLATLLATRPGSALAFDLVPWAEQPKPGRVGRALERWFKRFTKGQSFAFDERTRDDLVAQLRAAGFSQVEILEPQAAPARWRLPFLDRKTQTVVWWVRP